MVIHLNLVLQKQSAGLIVVANKLKLDFVGDGGGKPGAADDAKLPAIERQLGDVLCKPHYIIDARATHRDVLHENPLSPEFACECNTLPRARRNASAIARAKQDSEKDGEVSVLHAS